MLSTEELKEEHRTIKRMLRVMEEIRSGLEIGEDMSPGDLGDIVGFLRVFADECHHGKEEDLLFPAMVEAGVPRGGPIAAMLKEHEEGREYVKNLEGAIEEYETSEEPSEIIDTIKGYVSLLSQHISKEDNVLYPMANRRLTEEKHEELQRGFEEVEHEVIGEGKHEELHGLLENLEKTYLG